MECLPDNQRSKNSVSHMIRRKVDNFQVERSDRDDLDDNLDRQREDHSDEREKRHKDRKKREQ
jgi:hypothetical protein